MAGQFITLPSAPNTGAAQLGAALSQASGDYMQQSLQRQRIADERAYQERERDKTRAEHLQDMGVARANTLADVASERGFSREQDATRLRNSLTLQHSQSDLEIYRNAVQALINEHRLTPEAARDPAKFQAAFQLAQHDGLFQQYVTLLQTPGPDGKPFLSAADIGDKAKVDSAREAYGVFMAQQNKLKIDQTTNMQAYANRLSDENLRLNREADKLDGILSLSPDQAIPITQQDTNAEAARLAKGLLPAGKVPSNAQIAAQMDQANQNLRARQTEIFNEAKPRLQQQVSLLRSRIRENAISLADQAKKGFAPAGLSAAATLRGPADNGPMGADYVPPGGAVRANALASLIPKPPGAAPGPAPVAGPSQALFANPTANPTIEAGNAALRQQQTQQTQAALNAALQDGQDIDQRLQQAQSQVAFVPGMGVPDPSGMGAGMTAEPDPVGGAQATSSLLQAKAANDAKIQALRAQLIGPTPAGASAPSVNTVNGSTPISQIPSTPPSSPAGANWWDATGR